MMVKCGPSNVYGAPGGRIAVGTEVEARLEARAGEPTRGTIWMTALPVNQPGLATGCFTALDINGDTNGVGGDLLMLIGRSEGLAPSIAQALTQNFARDLDELEGKIKRAVDKRHEGALVTS